MRAAPEVPRRADAFVRPGIHPRPRPALHVDRCHARAGCLGRAICEVLAIVRPHGHAARYQAPASRPRPAARAGACGRGAAPPCEAPLCGERLKGRRSPLTQGLLRGPVLNPKTFRFLLENKGDGVSPTLIDRIAYQLEQRRRSIAPAFKGKGAGVQ